MKKVHIDMRVCTKGTLVDEVAEVLGKDDFDVELFGVPYDAVVLPEFCKIVDYGSRETLAILNNGDILGEDDVVREENINAIMCNTSYTREELEKVYDDPRLQKLLETYEWDDIFGLLEEIVERDVFIELKIKSKLYNMKMICSLADINYDTYKSFSSGRSGLSKAKAIKLLKTMENAFNLVK